VSYSYIDIVATILVAVVFVLLMYGIVKLFAPYNPNQGEKGVAFECGELPYDDAVVNFNIRYYVFALIFFVFDMEAIFLYPWAVVFQSLGLFGLVEMLLFLVVLAVGLFYAYKKGVLHWV